MPRDPRVDPRPGDVAEISGMLFRVCGLGTINRKVLSVAVELIKSPMSGDAWSEWAATATVIKQAEG